MISRMSESFKNAGRGLAYVFKKERNFRIQTMAGSFALLLVWFLPLRAWEAIMVLTMELLNTALENFTDLFKPRVHPYVGTIKDIMAAAVLVTSFGALIIGIIIFLPHFIEIIK